MSEVEDLWLRPLRPDDEVAAHAAHDELAAEGFTFLLDRDRVASWPAYLRLLERQRLGRDPHPQRVPASFLVADVRGRLVGRVSIRYELDAFLEHEGGHIGYAVRPADRHQGYAHRMLDLAVAYLHDRDERPVLVTCDDDNDVSAAIIEDCGGHLEDVRTRADGTPVRRYWIG